MITADTNWAAEQRGPTRCGARSGAADRRRDNAAGDELQPDIRAPTARVRRDLDPAGHFDANHHAQQ